IPIGRQAILAWRSLNPRARDEAWAAARQRSAPADLGVAYTAAGYGRTMARRRRVAMVLAAPLYLLVLIIVLVALLLAGVRPSAAPLVAVVVMAAYAAVAIPLWTQWRRFLRLHHSGVFGIEVAAMRA